MNCQDQTHCIEDSALCEQRHESEREDRAKSGPFILVMHRHEGAKPSQHAFGPFSYDPSDFAVELLSKHDNEYQGFSLFNLSDASPKLPTNECAEQQIP